jgi:predicted MFS family arabinose efflux permease
MTASAPEVVPTDALTPATIPTRSLWIVGTATFASMANMRMVDPILPQIATDFSITVGAAAAIVTVFSVAYGFAQIVLGPLGDRQGKYVVIAAGSALAGVATLGIALAATFEMVRVLRFAAGLFAAAIIPLAFAWIGDGIAYEKRQATLARFITSTIFGGIFGQTIGGVITDAYGWRASFGVIGALHILAAIVMLADRPPSPPTPVARYRVADTALAALAVLRIPLARTVLLTVAMTALVMFSTIAYVGADLNARFKATPGTIGLIMAAFPVGSLVFVAGVTRFVQALGEVRLVVVGSILIAIGFGLMFALPALWLAPVALAILGLGFMMFHNTLQTNATQMAPESRGLGVSLFAFTLFMAQSIGVEIYASIVDRVGVRPVYLISSIVMLLAAQVFRIRRRAILQQHP